MAAAGSTEDAVMFIARTVTVFAAETNAKNTMPAAGAAGSPKATASPTAAPATAIVRLADAAAEMDPKSRDADAPKMPVRVSPVAPTKPFSDTTGPEKVVRAMSFSLLRGYPKPSLSRLPGSVGSLSGAKSS